MKEIELTKGYKTMVDDADYEWLNQWKWMVKKGKNSNTFYAVRTDHKTGKEIRMHRLILSLNDSFIQGDHIDTNGLNNQRHNLRVCSNQENNLNKHARVDNQLGIKGVFFRNRSKGINKIKAPLKNYYAVIYFKGKRIDLGSFESSYEAAKAYNNKAIELHGAFARLNSI